MISYLEGIVIEVMKTTRDRMMLIFAVNDIGYELQIPSHFGQSLVPDERLKIFTHLQIRDELPVLYGFASAAERDLFRQLISVNGIGTQLAIALIDTLGIEALVQAIVSANIQVLSKTPGVGKKTAERIALELKTKLSQWRKFSGIPRSSQVAAPAPDILEDIDLTLMALGYSNEEIQQALTALAQDQQLLKNPNVEEWIRRAIAWLSVEL